MTRLSDEQALAAVETRDVFIEAFPGSGKTTVAAKRFGILRFAAPKPDDARAVVATSFTRSATRELRVRVLRTWGAAALAWPHRISTIDALVVDLVHALLHSGDVRWPGDHTTIEVHDSWFALAKPTWNRREHVVVLNGSTVALRVALRDAAMSRPPVSAVRAALSNGICTHEEMRQVLGLALEIADLRAAVAGQLARRVRALVVDEVFDANPLDLAIVQLAAEAGVSLSLVGDPWQALYGFRGASPQSVPVLVDAVECCTRRLTHSYRWASDDQRDLAEALRRSEAVALPTCDPDPQVADVDVVISCEWKRLWNVAPTVLPLAFSGGRGTAPEAAATLLLDTFTRSNVGLRAVNVTDALRRLEISAGNQLAEDLRELIELVRPDAGLTARELYESLSSEIGRHTDVALPAWHWKYAERLDWFMSRAREVGPFVPGLTAHQAKGREWNIVALALSGEDRALLAAGLDKDRERHRQLYVACTRARLGTYLIEAPQ